MFTVHQENLLGPAGQVVLPFRASALIASSAEISRVSHHLLFTLHPSCIGNPQIHQPLLMLQMGSGRCVSKKIKQCTVFIFFACSREEEMSVLIMMLLPTTQACNGFLLFILLYFRFQT